MLRKRRPFHSRGDHVDVIVSGIPAIAHITDYINHPGMSDPRQAPSDLDYYGYTEIEWDMLDRKGYRAKWLDRKLEQDPTLYEDVREQIAMAMLDYEDRCRDEEEERRFERQMERRKELN